MEHQSSFHSALHRLNPGFSSVFSRPAAQFLRKGALRLFREPPDLGAERRPAGAASLRDGLSLGDQFVQPRPGFGSIGLLRPVLTRRNDQHAVSRRPLAGKRKQALPYVLWEGSRLTDIKAQLNGSGDFVDVLAARTGCADKGLRKFGIGNKYRQMLFQNSL